MSDYDPKYKLTISSGDKVYRLLLDKSEFEFVLNEIKFKVNPNIEEITKVISDGGKDVRDGSYDKEKVSSKIKTVFRALSEIPREEQIRTCSSCGISFVDFLSQVRKGCPECFNNFNESLLFIATCIIEESSKLWGSGVEEELSELIGNQLKIINLGNPLKILPIEEKTNSFGKKAINNELKREQEEINTCLSKFLENDIETLESHLKHLEERLVESYQKRWFDVIKIVEPKIEKIKNKIKNAKKTDKK